MTKPAKTAKQNPASNRLSRRRAEKIAAIEGLHVSTRLARLLGESEHMSAEQRRAYVATALLRTKS